MIRKQTWILLGVFALLAGAAFYLQKNPIKSAASQTPSPTAPVSILKDWVSGDIVRINYQNSQGEAIQLQQVAKDNWMLQPEGKAIALGKIEEIRTQILDTQIITTLNAGYDLASIGVSTPGETITLTSAKGDKATIQIGNKTPIATGYYLQINQNPPVVVNNYSIESILDLLKMANLLDLTPTPEITPSLDVTATP
jgi:hypothetical protein